MFDAVGREKSDIETVDMREGVQDLVGDEVPSRDLYCSYAESGRPRYGGSIIEDSRECVDLIDDWNDLLGVGRIGRLSDIYCSSIEVKSLTAAPPWLG